MTKTVSSVAIMMFVAAIASATQFEYASAGIFGALGLISLACLKMVHYRTVGATGAMMQIGNLKPVRAGSLLALVEVVVPVATVNLGGWMYLGVVLGTALVVAGVVSRYSWLNPSLMLLGKRIYKGDLFNKHRGVSHNNVYCVVAGTVTNNDAVTIRKESLGSWYVWRATQLSKES